MPHPHSKFPSRRGKPFLKFTSLPFGHGYEYGEAVSWDALKRQEQLAEKAERREREARPPEQLSITVERQLSILDWPGSMPV